ncbi:MAG: hypothetical protein JTT14_00240 [Candidatus Brockarchaeota archaeon]|nr:hypothetical protein [Candidatus Brockarchaeota archaeon]
MYEDQELHTQASVEETTTDNSHDNSKVEQLVNAVDDVFWEMSHYLQKYMDKGTKSSLKKARVLATKLSKALKELRKGTRHLI